MRKSEFEKSNASIGIQASMGKPGLLGDTNCWETTGMENKVVTMKNKDLEGAKACGTAVLQGGAGYYCQHLKVKHREAWSQVSLMTVSVSSGKSTSKWEAWRERVIWL